ncbi:hypothetical protein [Propionibacterium australiense]|uniref:Uncharacterized protein n=1 Tax=Propionibacterium australiense TaxID=119981 RepID=A0A383S765_9ACTN|nr:hypothetical protein [Propionibacterium australiense]RLP09486.1 hypothetical protein D9T14_06905 [Propionibacterium australiense]RLP09936.1 hypothetical protein D7U36_07135 [Propionibacterium australiense]SYZ33850.1 Hypothetical protein PROPAUS_1804 [Propionibacterium australiense]VEH92018.1 Uncharacterised protein [Propionibacterium australiense]
MSAEPQFMAATAYALGGAAAAGVDATGVASPDALVARLGEAGWSAARLRAFRDECRAAARKWPLTVPAEIRAGAGFAQLHAWVRQCVSLLDLDAVDAGVRDHLRPPDRDDLRLMGERPPHHGEVG